MVYFADDLTYNMSVRLDSATNVFEIRNNHDNDSEEETAFDGVIISTETDPSYYGEEIRLLGDGKTPLSDIAKAARVTIFHDDSKLTSQFEFIQNYQSILRGEYAGWTLRQITVWPRLVKLGFYDEDGDWEEICLEKCPFDLMFEIPREEDTEDGEDGESGEPESAYEKLFSMGREQNEFAHGGATRSESQKNNAERIIIRYNPDKDCTEIWAGEVSRGINSSLHIGQKMLSVAYDDDDDIIITRYYHAYDLDGDLMLKALEPFEDSLFCL